MSVLGRQKKKKTSRGSNGNISLLKKTKERRSSNQRKTNAIALHANVKTILAN